MNPNQGQIGNGQQFAPGQYQTPTYKDIGFNAFMERQPSTYNANGQLNSLISPFISEVDESGYLFTPFTDMTQVNQGAQISGNQVSGGQTSSNSGGMTIDLTAGNINFTNGVTNTTLNANGLTTTPATG
ncbi:MAG: hypothetical protein ACRDFB_03705 [Rhabdochlamydiaceae bacterium]